MQPADSMTFSERAARALKDQGLQQALSRAKGGFVDKRKIISIIRISHKYC